MNNRYMIAVFWMGHALLRCPRPERSGRDLRRKSSARSARFSESCVARPRVLVAAGMRLRNVVGALIGATLISGIAWAGVGVQPGKYVAKGASGTLVIEAAKAGALSFTIESTGPCTPGSKSAFLPLCSPTRLCGAAPQWLVAGATLAGEGRMVSSPSHEPGPFRRLRCRSLAYLATKSRTASRASLCLLFTTIRSPCDQFSTVVAIP
jgi:outer membrane lipoprotein SlyB